MAASPLVLIGAGHMGGALVEGWLKASRSRKPVLVDPKPSERVSAWAEAGRIRLNTAPQPAGTLVLAVKPQLFRSLAAEIEAWVGPDTLILSVMAGIRIDTLAKTFDTHRIVRVMPNTPAAIGQGVALLAAGSGADEADIETSRTLLASTGQVEGPMSEDLLSAATGLSGSGPAYVFLLAEALAGAGEAEGLEPELAERLAIHTIAGAAALMANAEESPRELRRAVTSPKGVTAAALDVLMDDNGLPSLFRKALRAATIRERALSRPSETD